MICPRCAEQISKVIYSEKGNRFYHYRGGGKLPCPLKKDVITSDMEIVKSKGKENKNKKQPLEKEEKRDEEKSNLLISEEKKSKSRLPISAKIKEKEGIYDMGILPSERQPFEILEDILRGYNAKEKITTLLVKKCARRSLTPDEVEYNLRQLGVTSNEAEWIADEYQDAITEERMRKTQEERKPRPRVIRESESESVREPYRSSAYDEWRDATRGINRNAHRPPYSYPPRYDAESASAPDYVFPPDFLEYLDWKYGKDREEASLSEEKIQEMIESAIAKKSEKDRVDDLSTSINELKISLKDVTEKIRNEIPSDLYIREVAGEATSKEESSKETDYEKTLKQKIEDLKEEREELKNELKDKEESLKEKIDSLEGAISANKEPQNTYNEDSWRYKSDITNTVMRSAANITKEVLNEAPLRKGLNSWIRASEGAAGVTGVESEEKESVREVEPKREPPQLPERYVSEE